MLIAMLAFVLRWLPGISNPGGGLDVRAPMLVYGVAFDFFNVSGALFVEKRPTAPSGSAQVLFMLMTNSIGATVGIGRGAVVNHFCKWTEVMTPKAPPRSCSATGRPPAIFAICPAGGRRILSYSKYKHVPEAIGTVRHDLPPPHFGAATASPVGLNPRTIHPSA
ncbi:MAG: hypothetical protein ACLS37_13670 [Alistipes sp.]